MYQGETPKWRDTLSRCLEVGWSQTLEICERKHIIEWRNSGQFFRQSRKLLFCIQLLMQRCKDNDSVHHNKHPPLPQFRWSCIIPDKIKAEGQTDLAALVLSRSSKSLNGLIENTWKMNNAKTSIEREKTIRIQILRKCQSESCVDDCEMEWYECARQGIQLNSINPFVFPEAMRDSLWMEEASSAMYW